MFIFSLLCAAPTKLTKKETTVDFLIQELVKHNESLRSLKAKHFADKEKKHQAMGEFMPKVDMSYDLTNEEERDPIVPIKTGRRKNRQDISGTATLNLFKGFGDVASVYKQKHFVEASRYEYYQEASKVFLSTLEKLLQINEAITNLDVKQLTVDSREKIYFIAKNKLHTEAFSLSSFKTTESERDTALSEKYKAEGELDGLIASFVLAHGLPLEYNYIIELPKNLPDTIEQAEALMLKHNFDIQKAYHDVTQAEAQLREKIATFSPQITGSVSAKKPVNLKDEEKVDMEYTASIKASLNLFNGFKDSSVCKEAYHILQKARFNQKAILGKARADLKATFVAYKNALEQKKLLENAVQGFEIAANAAMIQYESGAKSVTDIIQEQNSLSNAKSRLANNEKDLRLNAWKLTILIGRLHQSLQKL